MRCILRGAGLQSLRNVIAVYPHVIQGRGFLKDSALLSPLAQLNHQAIVASAIRESVVSPAGFPFLHFGRFFYYGFQGLFKVLLLMHFLVG
jgi:hypothetical protein